MIGLKDAKKFVLAQELKRIRKSQVQSSIQLVMNLSIFRRKCHMNVMQKSKFHPQICKFAKKAIRSFIRKVPASSEEHLSVEQERHFLRVDF